MPTQLTCFASAAPGLEPLVAGELAALGIDAVVGPDGAGFQASLRQLYGANLELRTATRVLVRLAEFPARTFFELERKARRIPWSDIVAPGTAVRFQVASRKSRLFHAGAIAERLMIAVQGVPAPAAPEDPRGGAQLFVVRVFRDQVTVSADSSGELLHRRGYRLAGAKAPLRETLAAAALLGAGYDGTIPLVDPFCGSGTIPIEAALLARRIAPGLHRRFAFAEWPGFDAALWDEIRAKAVGRILPAAPAPILGSDRDQGAIAAARQNAERAGVASDIIFKVDAISSVTPPPAAGFLVTNPPYGVRIGKQQDLRDLYARFGALLRERWTGWTTAMIAAGDMPEREMGRPFESRWESSNGGIRIRLLVSR